jgi:endonuclease YncB( thermonuclease family)
MHFVRSTWSRLFAFLGTLPAWAALLGALLAAPLWALTILPVGVLYELMGRLDAARVGRRETRTPAKPGIRWGAAATTWFVALALIGSASSPRPSPTETRTVAPTPPAQVAAATLPPTPSTPDVTLKPAPTAAPPTFGPLTEVEEVEVQRVIDGDTIEVSIDGQAFPVRYIGMDAPEVSTGDAAIDALAAAATDANARLVAGRTVYLETDTSDRDRFDRLLRHVWLQDGGRWVHVGLELVRLGLAEAKAYPPDIAWQPLLDDAEEQARAAGLGRWAPQPTARPTPVPTPRPTPPIVTVADTVVAGDLDRAVFRGGAGIYTWTTVEFPEAEAILRWDVTAAGGNCHVTWSVDPSAGSPLGDAIGVVAGQNTKGSFRFGTAFQAAVVAFDSTCPKWLATIEGETPPPPPQGFVGGGGSSDCHPSYEGACLRPDASDYDCLGGSGNGPYYTGRVRVVGPDVFDLDADGDGYGCDNS